MLVLPIAGLQGGLEEAEGGVRHGGCSEAGRREGGQGRKEQGNGNGHL